MTDETEINEKGGKQSKIVGAFTIIPGSALRVLASVFGEGARKYARNNWRLIPLDSHLNHAMNHIAAYLESQETGIGHRAEEEDHLSHAFCRLAMAVAIRETGEYEPGDPRIGLPPKVEMTAGEKYLYDQIINTPSVAIPMAEEAMRRSGIENPTVRPSALDLEPGRIAACEHCTCGQTCAAYGKEIVGMYCDDCLSPMSCRRRHARCLKTGEFVS